MTALSGLLNSMVSQASAKQRKMDTAKEKLLEDPKKLDDYVGKIFQQVSPSKRLAPKKKAELMTDRIDLAIDEDHPMKGFGFELKEKLASELASPRNRGYSTREITSGIVRSMLDKKDEGGSSRLERAYAHKRLQDTAFFGDDVKEPLALPGQMTYKEWREEKLAQEQQDTEEEQDYLASLAAATFAGGTMGAGFGFAAGGPVGAAAGAGVGAVSGAAVEAVAWPARKWFEKTEWASARKFSSSRWDRAKVLGVELAPEIVAGSALDSALARGFRVTSLMKSSAVAKPSAAAVVAAKDAEKAAAKAAGKNTKAVAKAAAAGQAPVEAVTDAETFVRTLLPDADVETVKKVSTEFSALDNVGKKEAAAHPEGIAKGVEVAAEKQSAREFAAGKVTADELVSKQKAATGRAKKAKKAAVTKELEEASKEAGQEFVQSRVPVRTGGGDEAAAADLRAMERESLESFSANPAARDVLDVTTATTDVEKRLFVEESRPLQEIDFLGEGKVAAKAKEGIAGADDVVPEKVEGFRWTVDENSMTGKQAYQAAKEKSADEVYDAIDEFNERMFNKYFPDEDFYAPGTKGMEKVSLLINQLPEKMTKRENAVFDSLLRAHDELSEGATRTIPPNEVDLAFDLAKEAMVSKITKPEAMRMGADIAKQEMAGKMTKLEALKAFEDLQRRVEVSVRMNPADQMELFDGIAPILSQLRKQAGLTTFFAAMGVGAEVFDLFSPSEAEAGIGSATTRMLLKSSKETLMAGLEKAGHIVPDVVDNSKFFLKNAEFQRGLADSAAGGPSKVLRNMAVLLKTGKYSLRRSLMNPYQQMNEILNLGEGIMNNPAVFKASYMMAEYKNIRNGLKVFGNMLKEAGIPSAKKEVEEAFKPLIPLMKKQVGFEYYTDEVAKLEKQLSRLQGKKVKDAAVLNDIKSTKQRLAIGRKKIKEYEPGVAEYHAEWEKVAAEMAEKHPAVKVFLAADDSAEFAKYPFLRNLPLAENEQLLVGRVKRQMAEYRGRLEDAGVKTRSGDYMHYTLHPDAQVSMMAEITGDTTAAPFLKNYSRTRFSRPLIPDIEASVAHYVPDVERRLQNQMFWKSGWNKVRARARFIKPLAEAFDALEKGVAPIENSFGNQAAMWYANFETFKRLFLNPSAGLKHLVKISGDMATAGVGETLAALPSGIKGVSWRIADYSPKVRSMLDKLGMGSRSEYDRLHKMFFNSAVPAMDTRFRMSQMGFDNYDTYFDKFIRATEKVNHVGSTWINLAELVDRGTSLEAGLRLAAKKGMTAEQALYGVYDLILKNNFLGREFSPTWLRNPKLKALMLFQMTPFKILERRVVTAIRAGRAVEKMGKSIFKATKTAEGRAMLLNDLKNMRAYMKGAERELKSNLFIDALRSETDFFGNAAAKQFAKDLLVMGAGTIGGSAVGVNLWHHFFHLPFVKGYTNDPGQHVAISPGLSAVISGYNEWSDRDNKDDEFLATKIIQRWLGPSGPMPDIIWKFNRMSKNDIPEIYQDSKFKYLFALPAAGEH